MAIKNNSDTIGILMGGPSEERSISIKSGKAVSRALSELGFKVADIIIPKKNKNTVSFNQEVKNIIQKSNIDIAFITLHGWFGEDGTIQNILESLGVPYTGSCPDTCKKALNKVISRKIFSQHNIPIPKCFVLEKSKDIEIDNKLLPCKKFPVVVKPARQGSSIGLSIVENLQQFQEAVNLAFKYDDIIIIEEYLSGKELTVGILNEEILPTVEIITEEKFYNYKAKYQDDRTKYLIPAPIDEVLQKSLNKISINIYRLLGCKGMARVDIKLDEFGDPKILELNTIPGLTSTSLLPKAARLKGIDFGLLCVEILNSTRQIIRQ